jgi:hypothetical protein
VQTANFKTVMPDGIDAYEVTFSNGHAEFGIALEASGIIAGVGIFNVERK